jgi:hypothetical protein
MRALVDRVLAWSGVLFILGLGLAMGLVIGLSFASEHRP